MAGKFWSSTAVFAVVCLTTCSAENCVDLQNAANGGLSSGSYTIDHNGNSMNIYCLYYQGYGYTFISPSTRGTVDMTSFQDDTSHVLIRHKRANGLEYYSTIEQLSSFSSTPVSVQFNKHDSYQGIQNTDMYPYVFVGFIPQAYTSTGDTQGWRVNGDDMTFTNCDGNPNSYLVALFNQNSAGYASYAGGYNTLMFGWYDKASQVTSGETISDSYFTSQYEIHHGGCGGYSISPNVADITGIAIGVKFTMTCSVPGDISYSSKSYTGTSVGSVVTYTCSGGYTLLSGDLTRTCSSTGGWSGSAPVCGAHGDWSTWSAWAGCTVTCGTGTWTRSRSCTNPAPTNGGNDCSGSGSDSGSCTLTACPVDGNWADWSSWGSCDVTCGGGTTSRSRTCSNPAASNGGLDCQGDDAQTTSCNDQNCPIDGGWTDWTTWTSCSVTCGGSTITRDRTCTNPSPQYNGADCSGDASETTSCNTNGCPVDGNWADWSSWGSCDVTCGGGTTNRSRTCSNPAASNGGLDCQSDDAQTTSCNDQNCPIDGGWTDWTTWTTCSVTCGGSTIARDRTCTNPSPQYNGADCSGDASETTSCNTNGCPVDGNWTDWSSLGLCDVTCGGGTTSRSRTCSNPAASNGGLDCQGDDAQTTSCNDQNCPIDGGWGDWSVWTTCSQTCDSGVTYRTRDCDNPTPQYGGNDCAGDDTETDDCLLVNCPVDGNWGTWTYSACSVTCGYGTRSGSRSCDSPAPAYGGLDCVGDDALTEDCIDRLCIGNGTALYVNQCGSDRFTCFTGNPVCVPVEYICDCRNECEDGSDEDVTWALCDPILKLSCSSADTPVVSGMLLSSLLLLVNLL